MKNRGQLLVSGQQFPEVLWKNFGDMTTLEYKYKYKIQNKNL